MTKQMIPLILALLTSVVPVFAAALPSGDSEETVNEADDRVLRSVEHALPYLERGGVSWMDEQGCVSCHRATFMVWAHEDARSRGIDVDETKLESWTNRAFVSMLSQPVEGGGADSMAQMLLGRDRASAWREKPPRHFKTSDPYETLYEMLLNRQDEDGSWPPEGQLATPPSLTTAWVLLALASRSEMDGDPGAKLDPDAHMASPLTARVRANGERIPGAIAHGLSYVRGAASHGSNEFRVLRALTEAADPESRAASGRAAILLGAQNPDGGWSQRPERAESDAYATGMTLYALVRLGVERDDPAIRRARSFLITAQQKDGAWVVPADAIRAGKRDEVLDEIFSYWGSAWATIGLSATLPLVRNEDR